MEGLLDSAHPASLSSAHSRVLLPLALAVQARLLQAGHAGPSSVRGLAALQARTISNAGQLLARLHALRNARHPKDLIVCGLPARLGKGDAASEPRSAGCRLRHWRRPLAPGRTHRCSSCAPGCSAPKALATAQHALSVRARAPKALCSPARTVLSFLWQTGHLKCLAFWCWIRVLSSLKTRSQ